MTKTEKNPSAILYEKQREKIEKKISELMVGKRPISLYEPCSYIMESGGKRLRPLLVILSARAAGGDMKKVYNAAVAVELLHNFTLVHDDIMDNASKRRGRTTVHIKYDLSTAILTGDNLLAVAYLNLLKDCGGNDKAAITAFTNGVIEVCEGQSLDKDFELRDNVSLDEYIEMIGKKTAALLSTCCAIGAMLAGGNPQVIRALSKYGKYLGIAFQIQDDLLDLIAEEAEFGKTIGGDLIEGKKTFLFLSALEKAGGSDRDELLYVIKNKGIDAKQLDKYKALYSRLGVIDDARKEIARYTSLALKELKIVGTEDREILTWLANSLIKRMK